MKEVASRAQVSESTVSHVVNATRTVSDDKKSRVLAAMQELGFSTNAHARGLARGRSDFIGLIVSDMENPFFPGVIKAFEDAATQDGFDILLFSTNYDAALAERACRKLVENQVSAVAVMTSQLDSQLLDFLSAHNVNSVMLDGLANGARRSSLRLRYEKGAVESVQYLHNLGHKNLAMIAGPQNRRSHIAYRTAVESAAMTLDCSLRLLEGDNTPEAGKSAVMELLTSGVLPSAILCSNDLTAVGAMQALALAGLRVPEDISIVGADDIPMARLLNPALTTVHLPRQELGRMAFAALRRMQDDPQQSGTEVLLDTRLVVRQSTAAAKAVVKKK